MFSLNIFIYLIITKIKLNKKIANNVIVVTFFVFLVSIYFSSPSNYYCLSFILYHKKNKSNCRSIIYLYSSLNFLTIIGFNNSIIINDIILINTTNNNCDIVIIVKPKIFPIGVKNTNT